MLREHTLGKVKHPDPLRMADSGRVLTLIDDPVADRLSGGDPLFGWEGDDRLALYIDYQGGTWDLVRLERDGIYRVARRLACQAFSSAEVVPELILWLTRNDTRRGYDPHRDVVETAVRIDAQRTKERHELVGEAAERVHHGLRKDGAL